MAAIPIKRLVIKPNEPLLEKFCAPYEIPILLALWAGCRTDREISTWACANNHQITRGGARRLLLYICANGMAVRTIRYDGLGNRRVSYAPASPDESTFVRERIAMMMLSLLDDYPDEFQAALAALPVSEFP